VGIGYLILKRLITRHTEIYEAMGSPPFLTMRANFATVRFILGRKHRLLCDQSLAILSDLAIGVLLALVGGFVTLFALTW